MEKELLALKYRPLTFEDVIGQDRAVKILTQVVKSGKSVNSLLLSGPWGSGKTTLARIFSRALVCENRQPSGSPCNLCQTCKDHISSRSLFYSEIDAATSGGVDDIRQMKEQSSYGAMGSDKKRVIVIDECHRLSSNAMDALLKLFEEGSRVIFALATTDPQKLLRTVVSRCVNVNFDLISAELIEERLKYVVSLEKIDADVRALKLIAQYSNGHMRDALMMLDQVSDTGVSIENVRAVMNVPDKKVFYEFILQLQSEKENLLEFMNAKFSRYAPNLLVSHLKEAVHDCVVALYGVEPIVPEDQSIVQKVLYMYKESIESIASYIKNLSQVMTFHSFVIEILLLKSLLEGENKFLKNTNVKILVPPKQFDSELARLQFHARKKKKDENEVDVFKFAFLIGGRVISVEGE